ncbi:MAG: M23 family metallopeptidase [Limnohabitans sp.]|nr:M23 family metallopeptidase [Limnohabitans sp.]
MKKFDIDNINISLTQHDSQNDPNELAKSFQDRLEQVATVWDNHQSIEDLYFEEQEKLMQQNIVSTSTEGGAAATTNPNAQPFAASTTPSVTRGIITTNSGNSSIPSFSFPNLAANEGTAANQSEFADSQSVMSTVPTSQSTASSTAVALNDSINPYSGISSQQTITIPQENNENETAGLIQKIKDKRDLAAKNNDTAAVEYWNKLLTKLEEGTAISTLLADKEVTENPLFAEFKSMTQPTNEMLSFNWETVRLKMIAAIDSKIINGNRDKQSVEYWKAIRARLSKSDCNVANLFEEYDELFLLLKEVEGLTELPSRITFFTPTKVYPDLSPDKMYANLGIDDIYVFLKTNRTIEREGAGVNKGAVYIKNSTANSFITGETIEFGLNEELVNASKRSKEDINWVVYNGATKKGSKTFMNEGTSFNYNFSSPGKYIIEAYGGKKGATKKATKKQSAFVEVTIVNQEIEINLPQSIKENLSRPFATEKPFTIRLKENKKAQPLFPVVFSYQIQHSVQKKIISVSEKKPVPQNGQLNLSMPELGTYTIKVSSDDRYGLTAQKEFKIIKNSVKEVQIVTNKKPEDVYLHSDKNQVVTFAVKKFRIEPPTADEIANVRWIMYDAKSHTIIPKGLQLTTDREDVTRPYLAMGKNLTFTVPKTDGDYYVQAYSFDKARDKSAYRIKVVTPAITEVQWVDANGGAKTITGFKGETNVIKAKIPYFNNQKVRVLFYVKKSANAAYSKEYEYYSDTTTDANGNINKQIVFNDKMKSEFKLGNGENAFLKIDFVGYVNNEVYRFKEAKYNAKDVEIQLTTKRQLLDLYFEYDGRRVMEKDRVPYDTKKVEFIKLIAKTRNMAGEKINFTAHGLGQSDVLGKIGETVVKNNGVATIAVSSNTIWGLDSIFLPKIKTKIFYAGIEGFSTKHIENKTLVLEVGAKWDTNTIIHNMTWGNSVSQEFREKVVEICLDIWQDHPDLPSMINGLMAVMRRETAGTFAPHQIEGKELKNVSELTKDDFARFDKKTGKVNGSRAVGLIQFTQDALEAIGDFKEGTGYDKLHTMKLKYAKMTQVEQLEKVRVYFHKLSKLPQTPEDIYAAVFAPTSVGKKNSDTIYAIGTDYYERNHNLDVNKEKNGIQKIELMNKFYESLTEGNKSGNIAVVTIKIEKSKKWHHPLDRMELRGWYGSGFYPGDSDHGDAEVRVSGHHDGLDLYAPIGTQIYACVTGEVYDDYYSNTYGNTLGIEGNYNGQKYYFFYAHLSEMNVKKGDKVTVGDPIGKTGQTGNASGQASKMNHLHFEVRNTSARTGGKLNPLTVINELNKDVVTNPDKNKQTGN